MSNIIISSYNENKNDCIQYVTLLILKLHKFYLKTFHQSYSIDKNSFLIKILKQKINFKIQIIFSEVLMTEDIYDLVIKHDKYFSKNKYIQNEIKIIQNEYSNILKGIYFEK